MLIDHSHLPTDTTSIEYFNTLYKGPNFLLSIVSLISFIGGRHVVSDFYEHRQDLLCNPLFKVLILFCIIYMNFKNLKVSIALFFLYVFFIDNYIENSCSEEYMQNINLDNSVIDQNLQENQQ